MFDDLGAAFLERMAERFSEDELKRRLDDAARFAPIDRLYLSPQCGFASNYLGNPVTVDDEKVKLARIVTVAEEVWGDG